MITLSAEHNTARVALLASVGIGTGTVRPGRCGKIGCTVAHPVYEFVSPWRAWGSDAPLMQWRGAHHGQTFIYEPYMIIRDAR